MNIVTPYQKLFRAAKRGSYVILAAFLHAFLVILVIRQSGVYTNPCLEPLVTQDQGKGKVDLRVTVCESAESLARGTKLKYGSTHRGLVNCFS